MVRECDCSKPLRNSDLMDGEAVKLSVVRGAALFESQDQTLSQFFCWPRLSETVLLSRPTILNISTSPDSIREESDSCS